LGLVSTKIRLFMHLEMMGGDIEEIF
jgi:hypothetical protein